MTIPLAGAFSAAPAIQAVPPVLIHVIITTPEGPIRADTTEAASTVPGTGLGIAVAVMAAAADTNFQFQPSWIISKTILGRRTQ
jgi:hypothetical protein